MVHRTDVPPLTNRWCKCGSPAFASLTFTTPHRPDFTSFWCRRCLDGQPLDQLAAVLPPRSVFVITSATGIREVPCGSLAARLVG